MQGTESDDAIFYCDLVCSPDRKNIEEEIVNTNHELGTVQSYFNDNKIDKLFNDKFEVIEKTIIDRHNLTNNTIHSRYHLVLKKI